MSSQVLASATSRSLELFFSSLSSSSSSSSDSSASREQHEDLSQYRHFETTSKKQLSKKPMPAAIRYKFSILADRESRSSTETVVMHLIR